MKKLLIILFAIMPLYAANCADVAPVPTAPDTTDDDIIPASVLLARDPDATECATAAFANALVQQMQDVPEDTPQPEIETLIRAVFSHGPTLERVLACPEIANMDETDSVKFLPIKYKFPGGREIVINYETQPNIIKQRVRLANRATMPAGDPSPRLGDLDDPSVWTNTNPAWYGIIAVESGALDQFVGDGKNNTISLRYIEDNINTLLPKNDQCTGISALANNDTNINKAMDITTGDDQDYYVSGDVNLQWISYMEIGLDVVITVATLGTGAVITGATKAARASKAMYKLAQGMRALEKTEDVASYIRLSQKYKRLADKVENLKRVKNTTLDSDLARAERHLAKMTPGSKNHIAQQAKVDNLRKQVQALDDLAIDPNNAAAREVFKNGTQSARRSMRKVLEDGPLKVDPNDTKEMEEIAKTMKNMEKTSDNVKNYKKSADTFSDLNKYRHQLQLMRRPAQRGNVVTRTLRSFKAANTGTSKIDDAVELANKTVKRIQKDISKLEKEAKKLTKSAKKMDNADDIAQNAKRIDALNDQIKLLRAAIGAQKPTTTWGRIGAKTGRLRDWLFHSSMKNIGKLGRLEQASGLIYGAMKFVGDMYDWSETSTGDFTNGIQFKPLLLLSADDIDGQENVVNHGMWLLWQGDTFSASDDDAAYLQAMDFAEKFYRDLLDVQEEANDHSCNIDIYVVRPIIRNPGEDNAELYYLIMNDTPWSTAPHNN